MILVLRGTAEKVQQRLRANGIDFAADRSGLEVDDHGVKMPPSEEAGPRRLATRADVAVRKNSLLVTLNPQVSELLGYTPAYPTLLTAGWWAPVEVGFQSEEDCRMVAALGLPWLVTVSLMPVAPMWD